MVRFWSILVFGVTGFTALYASPRVVPAATTSDAIPVSGFGRTRGRSPSQGSRNGCAGSR